MNIHFQCPVCGSRYEVGPEAAGTQIQCGSCKTAVLVPHPLPLGQPRPRLGASRRRRAAQSSLLSNKPLVIGIAGGSALLVLIIALGFALSGGSKDQGSRDIASAADGDTKDNAESTDDSSSSSSAAKLLDAIPSFERPGDSADDSEVGETAGTGGDAGAPVEQVPWDSDTGTTLGPTGCPVMVTGNIVWKLPELEVSARLQGSYKKRVTTALSPDGSCFLASESHGSVSEAFYLWDTETGKQRCTVRTDPGMKARTLILTNGRLFLGELSDPILHVYDTQTGQKLNSVKLPLRHSDPDKFTVTDNGLYVACVEDGKRGTDDRLVVIKVDTGETIVKMRPPKAMGTVPDNVPEGMVAVDSGGWIIDENNPVSANTDFVFSSIQGLRFSPDSREVAAVSTHPRPRLICWNHDGRRVFDEPFSPQDPSFNDNSIHWFPGKNAWLIDGDILDRESQKVVLSIQKGHGQANELRVLDDDRLIGRLPGDDDHAQVYEIPWDKIRASLAALEEEAPAKLGPAEPVSIVFELSSLRGNVNETVKMLGQAFEKRLAEYDLEVEKGKSTFFRMRFSEKAGDSLRIREYERPFDRHGRDTGRSATEAKGSLVVELVIPGRPEPIWRDSLSAISSRSFEGDITDAKVRDSMVKNLTSQLNRLSFPYFIPESEDLVALPVIMQ